MQKFNNPCIKTGDFARLCNTNKRTLFHYDDIGLLKPAYTDEKGYRYYSESQCDVFFTITCLREIGMPLKDIKMYIDHRNPDKLKVLLEEQHQRVCAELEHLKRIDQVIKTKISLVDLSRTPKVQTPASPVSIEEMPEEYLVTSPGIDASEHDIVFQALCSHIRYCSHNQLNAGHPYGAMQRTQDLALDKWDQYAFFFTKVPSPVKDHPCHVKQAGRYVTAYLKGDYYDAAHTYQEMLAFMRENALSSGEFAYKEAVLDEIAVQDAGEYITRISIRIDES